ncbi:cell division protein ZapE [Leucobacter allii]|uniref:cell division protein ZapE n=1 Tax=Leucobacter allii TaxID=2932247 RepID=UPI001FD0568A|nr:cell division protein ZapE [Leucobacter allii]UOR02316.1 cell division protein ZapE [Leucobacter allii]
MTRSPDADARSGLHDVSPLALETAVVAAAEARGIALDAAQRAVLGEAATILTAAGSRPDASAPVGLFLHGPAGRGKTWLMTELFRAAPLPDAAKRQVHFHTFFQELQRRFGARLSARDAIEETVASLLDGTALFFFDELHVHDPGGASLLNRLVAELCARGVPTLLTSNYAPELLLDSPVYHHVVEPSVRLIRERFAVRDLDAGIDYRRLRGAGGHGPGSIPAPGSVLGSAPESAAESAAQSGPSGEPGSEARDRSAEPHGGARQGFAAGRWIVVPSDRDADAALTAAGFLPPEPGEATTVLEGHRALRARADRARAAGTAARAAAGEIWFDFAELLEAPSIAQDYLDLVATHDRWVLTGVPPLAAASREARQRFVALIDVLAHAEATLVVCAATDRASFATVSDPPPDLFRAESRLALLGE